MFSSQSTLNSVGRNAGISNGVSNNYWYTEDNYPYVNLQPSGSTINATEIDTTNNILYLGGSFSRLYQHNANYHSIYDVSSSTFQIKSKNYGTNGSIYAYGLDTSNSILYVGGNFTSVTDNNDLTIDASYVAAWSIKTQRWTPLGRNKQNGLNGQCNAVAVDISNQEVYVGGNFTKVSDASQIDQSANYVAKWKVSTGRWSQLGASDVSYNNGLNRLCRTLVYDSKNTQLYVGGDFTQVRDGRGGDISANKIAIWKPSTTQWSGMGTLGNNGFNNIVRCSVYDSCKNVVYYGGNFTTVYDSSNITGLSANYVVKWDIATASFSRLGTASYNGVNSIVYGLAIDTSNQILYVSGDFTTVYYSSTSFNANRIAAWNANTSIWSALGTPGTTNNGITSGSYPFALLYDSSNTRLYVGGIFSVVADAGGTGINATNVVYWNISTSRWTRFGSGTGTTNQGVDNRVDEFALDTSNNQLYMIGYFTTLYNSTGSTSAKYVAIWNILTSTWSLLGSSSQNGLNTASNAQSDEDSSIIYDGRNNRVYVCGTFTTVSDSTQLNLSANRVAYWDIASSKWYPLGGSTSGTNGAGGQVKTMALDTSNNYLYISGGMAGGFTNVSSSTQSSISANQIARWNISTSTWTQMGGTTSATNGLNSTSATLALDTSKNLYISGSSTHARTTNGDISANYGVIWKPSTNDWSLLGATYYLNGLTDGSCNALALDSINQRLYVGGSFTTVKDTTNISLSANRIAYWNLNTSAWSGLGTTSTTGNGVDASVNALVFDSSNNRLYVGGNFKKVSDASKSDQSANYVAFWDASNSLWGQVGAYDFSKNGVDASVNALAFDSCKNILYVGGNFLKAYDSSFTLASPLSTQYLATWNPTTKLWSRIGNSVTSRANIYGLSSACRALTYDPSKRLVYVGGDHTSTCDSSNISVDASNIAYINLNTGNIYPLGSTSRNGTNDKVNSIKLDTSNNVLYVDGSFTRVTDISANYIAKYDVSNSAWSSLGSTTSNGLGAMGKALFYDNTNNAVYASGNFTAVRDGTTDSSKNFNYVAKWDVAKSAWSPLGSYGNGTNGSILTYAYDPANYRVYCGGSFTQVFDNSNTRLYANNVAIFDTNTSTWSVLGGNSVTDPSNNGINSTCRTLVYDQSNSQLYVGGDFTKARDGRGYDLSTNRIAYWDISNSIWKNFGGTTQTTNGLDGSCNALALDPSNQRLYVGGNFKKVNDAAQADQSANCVAYWDLTNSLWKQLGGTTRTTNGLDGSCNALVLDPSFTRLYVGGNFKKVSDSVKIDQSANYVAYWDVANSIWGKLGASDDSSKNGVKDIVRTLAYDNANAKLYVGGDFVEARDSRGKDISLNRVAIWNPSTRNWSGMGSIYSNGTNGLIYGQVFDSSNNVLYVGGTFTEVYDTSNISLSVNYIAIWNIATKTWSRLGDSSANGTDRLVNCIVLNRTKLHVGGAFTSVYDKTNNPLSNVQYMATWDLTTNTWSRMGGGTTTTTNGLNMNPSSMVIDMSNQVIYVSGKSGGGPFSAYDLSGTTSINMVGAFNLNSQRWSRLGSSASNGLGSNASGNIANCALFMTFDNSNSSLYAVANVNDTFYFARDDRGIDISINSVARWDVRTQKWFGLGGHSSNGTNGQINAYAYDSSRNRMYVGGGFTRVFDLSQIFLQVNNVAAWDIAGKYWARLGSSGTINGVDASVNALAIDSSNSRIYIGGNFKKMSDASKADQSANCVVYWDISNNLWGQMGGSTTLTNGLDGSCNALAIDNSNGIVYVGGNFRKVRDSTTVDQSANYVAYWNVNTNTWSRLGATDVSYNNGLNQQCRSLVYDPSKTQLYVGGDFTAVRDSRNSDILANRIAIWKPTTSQWSVMGSTANNGLDGSCNALALDSSNNRLYVGGNFKKVSDASQSDQSANYIAYWDLSNSLWFKLGGTDISKNGLDGSCNALAYDNSNNRLYVGGSFKKVSDSSQIDQSANYVVYWDVSNSIWKQLGGTTSTRNGASDMVNALTFDISKNVFVGGRFISVNDSAYNTYLANYNASWSPSTQRWSRLGSIVKNGLTATGGGHISWSLDIDTSNSVLYGPYSTVGYFDVSNSSGLAGKSLCAWDIKNEYWFNMAESNNATNNVSYGSWVKYDKVKQRVYMLFTLYNLLGTAIPDPSNGSLYINGVVYYDIVTKRFYPLGGANNSYATLTNGLFYYSGSSFSATYFSADPQNGNSFLETDNSGNLFVSCVNPPTSTAYNVAGTNNKIISYKSIVTWDVSNSEWNVLGSNVQNGVDASCISMVYDNSNQELYVGGNFANTTDTLNDYLPRNFKSPISKVAKWSVKNSRWTNIAGQRFDASNGTNGAIYASLYDSCKNIIYMGGNFTLVSDTSNGDLSANYIAAWDIASASWYRLGTSGNNGLNNVCNALAIDSSKQILYVGGNFNNVFDATYLDQSANYVAAWNISSQRWSILGASELVNGLDGSCNALALDSSNSRLYVGGNFLKVSDSSKADQSANYVAYWDISNSLWKKLGASDDSSNNGVKSSCRTLTYDQSNTQLYVGGDFTLVRDGRGFDISANRIAIWKPSQNKWSGMGTLGQNGTNGQISAYAYDSCKNVIYAGGLFTTVFDTSNINGLSANKIAKWDIATSLWSRLTDSSWNGVDASCNALVIDTSNQILYAGGSFTTVYDSSNTTLTNTQRVAAWNVNTSSWSRLGSSSATTNGLTSTSAFCNALAYDSSNRLLYVGGNFTRVGDSSNADFSANNVASWNVSTSRWAKIGSSDGSANNGLNAMCRSLVYDSENTQLYVGGDFTSARDGRGFDISMNRIARWNVSNSLWSGMGNIATNGTNYVAYTSGRIFASVYDSCKNVVYVSGDFTYVYDSTNISLSANYIAYWDITNQKWGRLGTASSNGLSGSVYTTFQASTYGSRFSGLAIDSSRQILYVSNLMTSVNDASGTLSNVKYIAAWNINTQRWYRLGGSTNNGTANICGSLAYDSRNNRLHVGGQFGYVYDTSNGTQTVSNIASWDISNNCWLLLGSGLNSSVFSMAMDVSNNYLWVTGAFYQGTDLSGVKTLNSSAYWNFNNSRWYPLGTTTYNGYAFYTNQTSSSILDASNNMFYVTIANSIQGGGVTVPFYDATSTSGLTAYNIAAYNILTSTWKLLGNSTYNGIAGGTMRYIPMFALDTSNSILYLSGNFTSVRDPTNTSQSVNYIAAWNIRTQTWSRLGTSTSNGITNNDNTESNGGAPMAMSVDSSCNLYVGSVGANVYDAGGTFSVNGVASWNPSTQRWARLGTTISNGLDGSCNAMVLDSSRNRLYVGGNFKRANDSSNSDLSTNCVAYWDTSNSRWNTLGGTTRTTNGLDGSCNALVFDSVKNRLYVGGNFRKVSDSSKSDQSANYIVYWDASNSLWGQIGGSTSTTNGVDGSVNALAFDSNLNVFVGGNFTKGSISLGDISANRAIIWSASTNKWTTLGVPSLQNGVTDGSVNALALDETNQRLYVGGSFSLVKDSSNVSLKTNRIAYWDLNKSLWNALGTTDPSKNGLNAICRTLNYNSSNTTLYAGGDFTKASDSTGYDLSANRIASWNPSTGVWTPFGSAFRNANNGLNNSVYTISPAPNNQIFVGGTFTGGNDISGSITANYGLIWNPSSYKWSKFGGYSGIRMDGSVNALAFDSSFTKLFLGGTFSRMSDNCGNSYTVNDGAIWNTNSQTLSAMGAFNLNGLNFYPNVFAMDTYNNVLYMGGNFTTAYDDANSSSSIFAMYVIGYDITNNKWIQLGNEAFNGVTGEVTSLAYDQNNYILYVSGNYTRMFDGTNGTQSVNYIAAYNVYSKRWGRLGSSTYNGTIIAPNSIAFNGNNRLYVGGNFTSVYDSSNATLTVKYMAAWDTDKNTWSRVGANATYNGVDASVNILQYNGASNYLLTVGNFSNINDSVNTKVRQIPHYATYKF